MPSVEPSKKLWDKPRPNLKPGNRPKPSKSLELSVHDGSKLGFDDGSELGFADGSRLSFEV
eukprot:14035322-Ditylum_brightwellii.AAC.1